MSIRDMLAINFKNIVVRHERTVALSPSRGLHLTGTRQLRTGKNKEQTVTGLDVGHQGIRTPHISAKFFWS